MENQIITFLIKCDDQKGIIAKLTQFFYQEGFNIISSQQYSNTLEHRFFMRIRVTSDHSVDIATTQLETKFQELANLFNIEWIVDYGNKKQNVAILVSHTTHNLYDLLHRHKENKLNCRVKLVVSNHKKLESIAQMFGIPFYHLPVSKETKKEQELQMRSLFMKEEIDLIIMARYMQILSVDFISAFEHKIINIHHSFLPAFQGANPYARAYERGVKLIGATAHYATTDLDEGPIIEQDVERITHESTPEVLKTIGADIETLVLARAVKYHLNNQVIVDKNKAIVFQETGA
ncbi:MAG: formyltetrahydrofolate deformylase [Flavobacteriales bacterium]